ncbi:MULTISPECIES: hypothetical protein [Pseudomonas]|uniref:hypothetical protein n=1 Tax=Pseudomonas TaxID=286 RepID=UPI000C1176AE|nr:hypothetical protein [Pseudomonadaceae bacterium]HCP57448.1 hypothetical protein [Pseudomonas sp.]|tara:strand:+ start:652 stop:996 length:345 start_codon:yes stop_codon:yes gene_type:complete
MAAFRGLLVLIFVSIFGYAAVVTQKHGSDFMPIFFGDMAALTWPGQFNFDFMCLLFLSTLWVAWRNKFSPVGLMLGLCAFFGGGLFLSAYLLTISLRCNGDMRAMLLGKHLHAS